MDSVKAAVSVETVFQAKKGDEIMSPEGVEESMVEGSMFFMTMTQGGKYRLYCAIVCPCGRPEHAHKVKSLGVFDSKEQATKMAGTHMMLMGSCMLDPKGTVAFLLGGEDK